MQLHLQVQRRLEGFLRGQLPRERKRVAQVLPDQVEFHAEVRREAWGAVGHRLGQFLLPLRDPGRRIFVFPPPIAGDEALLPSRERQ